ncbi:MAG: hypothetical protein KKH12_01740 [Gammaproteobacteria bacterium]|nr:hypothetical protein [Gammaproteobacteria bacterium]MBU1480375.1 hypothetical protein [Gammaproteobacteria bacterium]
MKRTVVLLLLVSIFFSGCASFVNQRQFIKSYEGAALSFDKSALLKPSVGVVILSIDGDKSKYFTAIRAGVSNVDADISFVPGAHQILVRYSVATPNGQITSKNELAVNFDAVAGHRYILNASENTTRTAWSAQIIDVTNKPELWCLWVYGACMHDRFNQGPSKPIPPEQIK